MSKSKKARCATPMFDDCKQCLRLGQCQQWQFRLSAPSSKLSKGSRFCGLAGSRPKTTLNRRYRRVLGRYFPAMPMLVIKGLIKDEALLETEATAFMGSRAVRRNGEITATIQAADRRQRRDIA